MDWIGGGSRVWRYTQKAAGTDTQRVWCCGSPTNLLAHKAYQVSDPIQVRDHIHNNELVFYICCLDKLPLL